MGLEEGYYLVKLTQYDIGTMQHLADLSDLYLARLPPWFPKSAANPYHSQCYLFLL